MNLTTNLTNEEKAKLFDEIVEKTIEASKWGTMNGNALPFQYEVKTVVVDIINKYYYLDKEPENLEG
jgi:hypothetical protein